ncbi:MAG: J domain-containing protein [Rickettsiales bacterium]|nr:J domain-containing protein [Pseudomonadota bacterium]MDA0966567.1 J domain-containing protein [Pseudomonadota bacterium]MDG4543596.1 J domain-containing protein [Rickettsiales bacterium]MDG4545743.1 J domain-containing protein [Rickettsiales bacterium]MDG4547484.1 J domain-containing protein [Rickettsiales bacterium]
MEKNQEQNNYEILGVERNADDQTIRRAYRESARNNHPDRGGDAEQFKKISNAYQTLGDPERKAVYDTNLRQQDLKIQKEQEEYRQFKAEKTLNSLLNQPDERKVDSKITTQSDEELEYLQKAAANKKSNEVELSKQNAKNNPEYQRELAKYSNEYDEWEDLATLIGGYGDPGPEPTKPSEPNRKISATERKVDGINEKISRELQERESGKEQDISKRIEGLSIKGVQPSQRQLDRNLEQEVPPLGQWSSAVRSQQQSNTRQNNRQDERNDAGEEQVRAERRVRWADDVQQGRGRQLG